MERVVRKSESKPVRTIRERGEVGRPSLTQLRDQLSIEIEDLDGALIEQPDLYYHVAERYAEAVAERDAAKLDLEEATAVLDEQFRHKALQEERKTTEAALQREIAITPKIMTLERDYLRCRADADKWQALKEAYQQRSFMLRELVAMVISRLSNLSLDKGMSNAHRGLAEANHAAAGALREERIAKRAQR